MFRLELLGEGVDDERKPLLEGHAPFRLILLGVMLANKWLDDNTFSNKTWHQVSGVPIRSLNKLEGLGLDLLSHDLSLPPQAWAQWLEHMYSYHRSLAPFPEPIGPPKQSPHVIIRRAIEELIEVGSPPSTTGVIPEPVFLGLAEHKRERERIAMEEDVFDVDLDQDGPLREEYLPKKHVLRRMERRSLEQTAKDLPPPAAWSPAADPPLPRPRPVYQAVQGLHNGVSLIQQNAPVGAPYYLVQTSGSFPGTIGSPFQRQVPTHSRSSSQAWGTPQHTMVSTSYTQPIAGIVGYTMGDMQAQYVSGPAFPTAPAIPRTYRADNLATLHGLIPTTWLRT